jgi:hypothetical protein
MLMPRRSHHTESLESWNKLCREAKEHRCLREWTAVSRARETTGQKARKPSSSRWDSRLHTGADSARYVLLPMSRVSQQTSAGPIKQTITGGCLAATSYGDSRHTLALQLHKTPSIPSVRPVTTRWKCASHFANVAAHPLRHVNKAGTLRMPP